MKYGVEVGAGVGVGVGVGSPCRTTPLPHALSDSSGDNNIPEMLCLNSFRKLGGRTKFLSESFRT